MSGVPWLRRVLEILELGADLMATGQADLESPVAHTMARLGYDMRVQANHPLFVEVRGHLRQAALDLDVVSHTADEQVVLFVEAAKRLRAELEER